MKGGEAETFAARLGRWPVRRRPRIELRPPTNRWNDLPPDTNEHAAIDIALFCREL